MTSLEYHRPQSLEEALELLKHGVPLAGGTRLTHSLRGIRALVDLQDLGLDAIELSEKAVEIGGAATLQDLIERAALLPEGLVQTARMEAGWNIRNKATVAGTVVTGDGRSPLLAVLLAMGTDLEFMPGGERVPLWKVLERGPGRAEGKLITALHAALPERLRYAQVARSPADRPQLCVAAAYTDGVVQIALGGFGAAPQLLESKEAKEAAEEARAAYAEADDLWASAEYRSAAAAALVGRVAEELELE